MENNLFEQGKFFFGCNWWASHSGTNMWHDWDAAVVEADIKRIKDLMLYGIRIDLHRQGLLLLMIYLFLHQRIGHKRMI